ncbi:MAG: hypothetical protein RI590_02320 [Microbacteriaceae bacterium]|jgi:hypothetical protein|nr:hypothetical protein [Microbacteriaceae bacterium]MDR9443549.1 hypothetical protein [Microbacteriaceae bacterium]
MAKKYWFNTKTQQVEYGRKSLAVYRLGPFETEREAKNAEQTISERGKKLIEEDQLKDSSEDGNSRD